MASLKLFISATRRLFGLNRTVQDMEDVVPKRAFTFVETKPDEAIYEICIKLKNVRGAVAKTAKVLSDANINIRTSMLFEDIKKSSTGYWTSFVDFSKTRNVKELEEKLRTLDVVEAVKIVQPQPLVYDVIHFPVMHGNSTAIILPSALLGSLFEEIEKILTPSGFAAVFYNAGKKSGASMAALIAERYELKGESLKQALIQTTKAIGWGQLEDLRLNSEKVSGYVKMRNCFEAVLKGQRREPACHWTRGFIAGFLGKVVGKPVEAVELKCAAVGDETCDFELKPKI
mgnify:CR=1 FL=1